MHDSFFRRCFTNPLVWVGFALTALTLSHNGLEQALDIFFEPETYRNLAIGAAIYTLIFSPQYKNGGEKIALFATLQVVVENMIVIFVAWNISLLLVLNYHWSGLRLTQRMEDLYKSDQENDPSFSVQSESAVPPEVLRQISDLLNQSGVSGNVTINMKR
jgi:hypothetical protein